MADKTVTYRLLADITQFRAQMAQAAASTRAAADRMTAATKEGAKFRSGLSTLGSTAGKVGLVAAAGLAIAIKTSADFEQSMSRVQAATHESATNMESLRAAAIKAGRDTVFSATEAADGITALAKAGVSTKDILGGALTDSLNLASAGEISVGQAAEIAATTMNQFGLKGKDVGHIADDLAAAAGKAQGEVTDMAEALKYVGPVAAQMGVSLDQTVGSIAELASQGVLGSEAGTSLRGMLTALTSPSKTAADTMKQLGINVYDAQGKFVGFDGIAGQLHDTMSKLSAADRDEALGRIFGNQQITAARILYSGGAAAVDKWTNSVNDSGYAAETARIKLDNLKGDLKQLGGSLETALITTGDSSQGPLRKLVQSLTDVVNAYNKLPPAAQGATSGLLGLTAVLGGGAWFSAKIISGVADTRKALTDLGDAAPKAAAGLRALGAVTVIAGGVLILRDAIDSLEKSMRASVPGTQELAGRLLDLSSGNIASIGDQFKDMSKSLDLLSAHGSSLSGILPDVAGLLPGYTSANEQLDQLKGQISGLDSALASIATSGSPDKARAAFAALAASEGLTADQTRYLLSQLPQYKEALAGAANATKLTGAAASSATGGVNQMGHALGTATSAAQTFKGALASLNGLLDKRDAIRNYQAALDDFRKNFNKSAGFNLDVDPGRQNQQKLDAIAASAGVVASHLHGLARTEFVNSAIAQLRALGHQLGIPPGQIQGIVAALQNLGHQHPTPRVDVQGIPQGIAQIASLRYQMSQLQNKTVFIDVIHRGGTQVGTNADGGMHEFYASGGTHWPQIGAQQPQIRAYSGARGLTWSEEGSGPWEAFISGQPSKADRSRAIATDVVTRLGGTVQFAHGGVVGGGGGGSSRGGGSVRIEGPVEIRGKVDLDTGRLIGTMEVIANRAVDDASDFSRTMAGRHS